MSCVLLFWRCRVFSFVNAANVMCSLVMLPSCVLFCGCCMSFVLSLCLSACFFVCSLSLCFDGTRAGARARDGGGGAGAAALCTGAGTRAAHAAGAAAGRAGARRRLDALAARAAATRCSQRRLLERARRSARLARLSRAAQPSSCSRRLGRLDRCATIHVVRTFTSLFSSQASLLLSIAGRFPSCCRARLRADSPFPLPTLPTTLRRASLCPCCRPCAIEQTRLKRRTSSAVRSRLSCPSRAAPEKKCFSITVSATRF
jgi:hypothetical protein